MKMIFKYDIKSLTNYIQYLCHASADYAFAMAEHNHNKQQSDSVRSAHFHTGPSHTHLPHHVGGGLPSSRADVLVEGDVEVCGRLVVLDHVEQRRRSLNMEEEEEN